MGWVGGWMNPWVKDGWKSRWMSLSQKKGEGQGHHRWAPLSWRRVGELGVCSGKQLDVTKNGTVSSLEKK